MGLFYAAPQSLGGFREVAAAAMPQPYRELLAHNHHMTVTVERHHGSLVDVRVLERRPTPRHYARKILLTRQSDGRVVQFGIVRLDLSVLDEGVRQEIESGIDPLGRILIRHSVLREVELFKLFEVSPGPDLCHLLNMTPEQRTYGRTALIHCNGQPAVELLEIVTPDEQARG